MYIDVTYNKQFALILNIVDIWMFFFVLMNFISTSIPHQRLLTSD